MKKLLAFVVLALIELAALDARAQTIPTPAAPGVLGGYAPLPVTDASARVALPVALVPFGAVTIFNNGSDDAYWVAGDSGVVATTAGNLIPAGKHYTIWLTGLTPPTHIAAIAGAADTTTLGIYQSTGLLDFGP